MDREAMRKALFEMADEIADRFADAGFVLIVSNDDHSNYISNVEKDDVVSGLRYMADQVEGELNEEGDSGLLH